MEKFLWQILVSLIYSNRTKLIFGLEITQLRPKPGMKMYIEAILGLSKVGILG